MISSDVVYVVKDEEGNPILDANGQQKTAVDSVASTSKSFSTVANKPYHFTVESNGETLTTESFRIVDQSTGYSYAIYLLSFFLALFLIITFLGTRERVTPPAAQKSDLGQELKDLIYNKPWILLVFVALMYNIYNNTKQGVTLYYFTHYIQNQLYNPYNYEISVWYDDEDNTFNISTDKWSMDYFDPINKRLCFNGDGFNSCKWLEPMCIMCSSFFYSPTSHSFSN